MATKIEEKLSKGYIHFSAILEIVGKPQEHVDSTFAEFISQMKKSLKYEVVKDVVHESIAVDGSENLFSSFAEIEILAKDMGALYDFCFENMPASVEIIAPQELKLKPNQASAAINDLIGRIHQVDMHAKKLTQQIGLYSQNLRIMIENAIVIYLSHKPRRIEDIAQAVGVTEAQLPTFLDELVKKERITVSDGIYGIAGKSIRKNESEEVISLANNRKQDAKKKESKKNKK